MKGTEIVLTVVVVYTILYIIDPELFTAVLVTPPYP